MAEKREGAALRKFKEDLAAGTPGPAYIFYGEGRPISGATI